MRAEPSDVGLRGYPESPIRGVEAYASMTGKRLTDQNPHLPIKAYQA
nr:hypothetical protein [Candidatus Freyrarchaeum guaymaensis]